MVADIEREVCVCARVYSANTQTRLAHLAPDSFGDDAASSQGGE